MIHPGLENVRQGIGKAALSAGRDPNAIKLIAVTKTFDAADILPVIAAGQTVFGENRVQEAQAKWPSIKAAHSSLKLHLIGPLQSNKTADAIALFDAIHTVDRRKIAGALAAEMQRQQRFPQLFVQVNTGLEKQKGGIAPTDADRFIADCREGLMLAISGLMCIPPATDDPKPHFELLAAIAKRNGVTDLSMGMSGDYAAAITCGATFVRVGSAIFGSRV
ncbi:MAG: YggS family pyridoxal phosphate-dependent enzyme [Rhizobiales bacterium]|nr:YggS family pyridoxal phosphate-dependent enzyme [Hyphomicrobiales bacterium]